MGWGVGEKVGFTTTIPVEVLFAAGATPCDLNNIFVNDPDPQHFVALAEKEGFPKSMCTWIKGLYGVIREMGIGTVVTVLEGDCSNTRALAEILTYKGVRIIPFSFPYDRDREGLAREIGKFMTHFGVDAERVEEVGTRVQRVRRQLAEIDLMTWSERVVRGRENHLWQVCASDMEGDYEGYGERAERFMNEARKRKPIPGIPIGYVGCRPSARSFISS